MKKLKKAFSLLELAIVLIILALLIATVSSGTALKRGAAIRTVVKEIEEIKIAFDSFITKFKAVPGDFDNASAYWPTNCASLSVSCNGDGDSIIEIYAESFLVWYHLEQANYYNGNFTGEGDGDTQTHSASVNVPKSSFPKAQYALYHYHLPEFPDKHIILMGAKTAGDVGKTTVIDANFAFDLDSKIDNGKPSSGRVYGRNGWRGGAWSNTNCLITSVGAYQANAETIDDTIEYDMNQDGDECIMGFTINPRETIDQTRTATD
jgi:prepilin-type N-terminal cleavage/methylation domain-containing protein